MKLRNTLTLLALSLPAISAFDQANAVSTQQAEEKSNSLPSTLSQEAKKALALTNRAGNGPSVQAFGTSTPGKRLEPGVVVEEVKPHLEGEAAGIKTGDILLRWTRADAQGEIASPFDLIELEIEQEPFGPVVLEGIRGTEKQTWRPGHGNWGIQTKPNFLDDADAQETAPPWWKAWERWRRGNLFADAKRWKDAAVEYQAAIQAAPRENPKILEHLYLTLGRTLLPQNRWAAAENYFRLAIAEGRRAGGENLWVASGLNALGGAYWQSGDLGSAEKYFAEALAIRKELAPDSMAVAKTLGNLGLVAWDRGEIEKAEQYDREALAISERLAPGSSNVAANLNNLGLIAWNRGDFDQAEELFLEDMRITKELSPESVEIAQSYMNLGLLAWQRGDLGRAEEYGRKALALFEKVAPESLHFATELTNLGMVLQDRGEFAKAEAYYRQALAIKAKLAPDSLSTAQTLQSLGALASDRGDYQSARRYLYKALAIDKKIAPNGPFTANALTQLGNIAGEQNRWGQAKRYLLRALAINQKFAPDDPDAAVSLNNLGEVALRRGRLTEAAEYLRHSLDILEKHAPDSLNTALVVGNLGKLARNQSDLRRAEELDRRALGIQEKLAPGSGAHAATLAALAGVLRQEGQAEAAERLYAKSLNAVENQIGHFGGAEADRLGFRARHADIYKDYIDLLIGEKRPENALEIAERSRARTILEMLARGHAEIRKGVDEKLAERERDIRASLNAKSNRRLRLLSDKHTEAQVAAVDKEIDTLVAQHRDVESGIRATSPAYAALTQPQALTVKQIREQLLDEDTALLEYSLADERSYVWAVTSNSLSAFELPKRAEIERAARTVYRLLTAKNQTIKNETEVQRELRWKTAEKDFSRAAAKLSRMILSPVAAQLAGKRLLIVSDGALEYVPFAVLPVQGSSASVNGSVPLVAEHEIVNLPSVSVLAVLRQEESGRPPAPMEVAILADPVFEKGDARVAHAEQKKRDSQKEGSTDAEENEKVSRATQLLRRSATDVNGEFHLRRLRYTRQEAEAILSAAPAGKAMSALDFQASREKALSKELERFRIVHFATHGLLDNKHPELSGLVFSLVDERGKPKNGFLELQDIYNMQLPVDLVVLSACETGVGKGFDGEGLVGLTRGFLYAGAGRVVASLWNVSDAATAQLMGEFYKGMEKDGLRPAAALRAAQIKMGKQKRWASPYYWGAFELQGEWK